MIELTWKRNRDGLMEAYVMIEGRRVWVGIVDGRVWALRENPIRSHIADSEEAAMVELAQAYQEGPSVRYPKFDEE